VHEYERWASTWDRFLALFKDPDGKINGWMITRASTAERWLTNIEYVRVYEMILKGVYGLKDEGGTELVFQQTIEDICEAFRNKDTLNDTCETIAPEFGALAGVAGVQVKVVQTRIFGNTLCHYAELAIGAQVTETRT